MTIDILMITYNRPQYTKLALGRLLETCDKEMRIWIWHNGMDQSTLDVVQSFEGHPRIYKFHHCGENAKLREPTNWLWSNAKGDYLCKVDDDCLMPYHWAITLRKAHTDVNEFGVIGCWRFPMEDFLPEEANNKIRTFSGGHRIMQNCWVEGSGYLMKRQCMQAQGLLQPKQSFTNYCIRLAKKGWLNGWYYPFLYQEHMDDPRSPHTLLKTDADMGKYAPLSAKTFAVSSIDAWTNALRADAAYLQRASVDPHQYLSWRQRAQSALKRLNLVR